MAEQSPQPSSRREIGISEAAQQANPPDINPTPHTPSEADQLHPASDETAKDVHESRNPAENRNAAAPVDSLGNRPETNSPRTEAHQYAPRKQEEQIPKGINPASGMPYGSEKEMNVIAPPGDGAARNEKLMNDLREEGLRARNEAFKGNEPEMGNRE